MPSHARTAKVPLDDADELADLYGVRLDLKKCATYCRLALALDPSKAPGYVEHVEGLIWGAIVRYGRIFRTGAREHWTENDVAELDHVMMNLHQKYFALRNRFVAHSVNTFEDAFVNAQVVVKDDVRLPIEHLSAGYSHVVLSTKEGSELCLLIEAITAIVERRIEFERAKLLRIIQGLPLEIPHSWDMAGGVIPGTLPPDTPRKSSRGARRGRARGKGH